MDSNPTPNCPGDQCLSNWLKWAHQTTNNNLTEPPPNGSKPFQAKLFEGTLYDDAAPKIRDAHEFRSAVETLAYAVFRLARNRLTRAERPRLENLVDNAIFKMQRHLQHGNPVLDQADIAEFEQLQNQVSEDRRLADRRKAAAQGIKHRLEQLEKLTPEEFEDFIGEVFEALDFQVERVGGSGDQGADLKLTRGPARAVVQCKFYKKSLISAPSTSLKAKRVISSPPVVLAFQQKSLQPINPLNSLMAQDLQSWSGSSWPWTDRPGMRQNRHFFEPPEHACCGFLSTPASGCSKIISDTALTLTRIPSSLNICESFCGK